MVVWQAINNSAQYSSGCVEGRLRLQYAYTWWRRVATVPRRKGVGCGARIHEEAQATTVRHHRGTILLNIRTAGSSSFKSRQKFSSTFAPVSTTKLLMRSLSHPGIPRKWSHRLRSVSASKSSPGVLVCAPFAGSVLSRHGASRQRASMATSARPAWARTNAATSRWLHVRGQSSEGAAARRGRGRTEDSAGASPPDSESELPIASYAFDATRSCSSLLEPSFDEMSSM